MERRDMIGIGLAIVLAVVLIRMLYVNPIFGTRVNQLAHKLW